MNDSKDAPASDDATRAMSNARRILAPKMQKQRNWIVVMELFGVGSTVAQEMCRSRGFDPDGDTFIKRAQPNDLP